MPVLDLSGLNCPQPVLKTKKFLAGIESGVIITVITTDSDSQKDLQDFCHKTGHLLLSQSKDLTQIITKIQRR